MHAELAAEDEDEDELARSFEVASSEVWAVYADELQSRGDLRGELIALELRLDSAPPGDVRTWLERARERLYAEHRSRWLGPELSVALDWAQQEYNGLSFEWRHGYLRALVIQIGSMDDGLRERVASMLDCEAARFLPRLQINGFSIMLSAVVEGIAGRRRRLRWLRLNIDRVAHDPIGTVAAARGEALADATPDLRELVLDGHELFEDLPHAGLETLIINTHDAIIGLGLWTWLPRLRHLDVKVLSGDVRDHGDERAPARAAIHSLLCGEGMPALRVLDLSRNRVGFTEDGHSRYGIGARVRSHLFEVLFNAGVLAGIEELILPSPPQDVIARLADEPALRRIQTIRIPMSVEWMDSEAFAEWLPQLDVGLIYPHRLWDVVSGHIDLSVEAGGDARMFIRMRSFMYQLEWRYPHLSPAARQILDTIADLYDDLLSSDDDRYFVARELPIKPLHAAVVELCEDTVERGSGLATVRDVLDVLVGALARGETACQCRVQG